MARKIDLGLHGLREQNSTSPTYKTNKCTMQSYVEAMSQWSGQHKDSKSHWVHKTMDSIMNPWYRKLWLISACAYDCRWWDNMHLIEDMCWIMGGIQATPKSTWLIVINGDEVHNAIHQPLVWGGEHQCRIQRFHPPPTKWPWCLQRDVDSITHRLLQEIFFAW